MEDEYLNVLKQRFVYLYEVGEDTVEMKNWTPSVQS